MKIAGIFRVWEHGKIVFETHNQITDIGQEMFVALATGGYGDPSVGGDTLGSSGTMRDFSIDNMQVTAQVSPTAADQTDTALEGTVLWTSDRDGDEDGSLVFTFPSAGVIRCNATIPAVSSIDGQTITEEGLFNANGDLLARATGSYTKANGTGANFTHDLTLSL